MKKTSYRLLLATVLAACLAGCASLTASLVETPSATTGSSAAIIATIQPTPALDRALPLTLWVPPQFDPGGGSLAATMLQNRLDDFTGQFPQVLINNRVKDENRASR